MKKFLGTRLGVIAVTSIISILVIGMVAQAALNVSKPLPASANIKSASANLQFSMIINGSSTPITSLDFGDIEQGTTKQVTVYLKNIGAYTINSMGLTVTDLDPAAANITSNFAGTTLAPGAVTTVTLTLIPVDNGPTGVQSPVLLFTATN